jgi:ergothioneine biosynthesis protein EgtB
MAGSITANIQQPQSSPPEQLAQRYVAVRRVSERIAAPLSADDHMVQGIPEASPTKWHLAHTTWFFETFILLPHQADYHPFDARFTRLFNSYYKSLGEHPDRRLRSAFSRPTLDEVRAYRAHVDLEMERLLSADGTDRLAGLVLLGINHEQQHQELMLTDIKAAFWVNPLHPAYRNNGAACASADVAQVRWIEFPGGVVRVGHDSSGFCFDNELPAHEVLLPPFSLADRLVTAGEFLAFIEAGGYRRSELWLSDGWDTVLAQQWCAPLYWSRGDGGNWSVFTLEGTRALHPGEPVAHVSYYEADAYARWAGARLPTEFESEIAARTVPVEGNLLDTDRLHPVPAPSGDGLRQTFGDVWEWTASPYVPYPGYRPVAGALGEYNSKFMCNQMVLRGGSCVTPQSHIRATYRNFFPPPARWQFTGIRLAR